jgi:hypothetical protein
MEILIEYLLHKAWEGIDDRDVLEGYASVVSERLQHHLAIPGFEPATNRTEDGERRRLLLAEAVIPLHSARGYQPESLVFARNPLLFREDVPWVLTRLEQTDSVDLQRFLSSVLFALARFENAPDLDAILVASERSPILRETFAPFLSPVELHSELAERLRALYRQRTEWEQLQAEQEAFLVHSAEECIQRCLDRFEGGDLSAWSQLVIELTWEPADRRYGDELESDLTLLPGWKAAEPPLAKRIIEAAKVYLSQAAPHPEEWIGKNRLHRPDAAGYKALRLLGSKEPAFRASLSGTFWKQWAPVIVGYPAPLCSPDEEPHQKLVCFAYEQAPQEVVETLLFLIDQENHDRDIIFIHRKVFLCWDDHLAAVLTRKVQDPILKPRCMESLLDDLLERQVPGAMAWAESLVTFSTAMEGFERERAIIAASGLLAHAADCSWARLWPVMMDDAAFGREVMLMLASRDDQTHAALMASRLTEDQMADLYRWLIEQFPPTEDPEQEGMHFVGKRESVALFREMLLNRLRAFGTREAGQAISRLARSLPEVHWLKWAAIDARRLALRQTWMAPEPATFLKLVRDRDARFVESGDQLLDVVIGSLQRLATKLQGVTPAAPDLWNEVKRDVFHPKDENALSNYVARHLRDDLKQRNIIVNREVEIRCGAGESQGERTDIYVNALHRGERSENMDTITVTIEVKGSWNDGLKNDLIGQLRDRYMAETECQHGLYLVGWFACRQWDPKDTRRRKAPKWSVERAQTFFDQQANSASRNGLRIKAYVLNAAMR